MRIAIAADHRGAEMASHLLNELEGAGHVVSCASPSRGQTCDYPDMALPVAKAVAGGQVDMGILVCGTGIGMSIAANKVAGVRAALVHDEISADISRRHNDANVLCLSADILGQHIIDRIVHTWVTASFEGGRHARRLAKITAIEEELNSQTDADVDTIRPQ